MNSAPEPIRIPDKSSFKAGEVCELLGIPAYVLRTWENEFADLGVAGTSGARAYRRRDVELAVLIRQLVFTEHLTLAGVRRRLEQDHILPSPEAEEVPVVPAAATDLAEPARERIAQVKGELRALLQELERAATSGNPAAAPTAGSSRPPRAERASAAPKSPSLPGLEEGSQSADPLASERRGRQQPRLDPEALQFATVSARTPAPARRRRNS